jgi:hypothetical protein
MIDHCRSSAFVLVTESNSSCIASHRKYNQNSRKPYTLSTALRKSLWIGSCHLGFHELSDKFTLHHQTLLIHSQIISPFCTHPWMRSAFAADRIDQACAWRALWWVEELLNAQETKYTYRCNTCVIREHKAANSVVRTHIRRPTSECNLYRSRTPWNEVGELPFTNPKQRLMNLECIHEDRRDSESRKTTCISGINFSLDDVKNGDVACGFAGSR